MKIATKLELKDSAQAHGLKNQSQVEGIITSKIESKTEINKLGKWLIYYLAFFQLEGIEKDIPIIFRLKDNSKPNIPPRAKILLKGTWSESAQSTRPSFTCQEYQVLANPPPLTVKDLKEQVSQLLSISLDKKTEWQQRVDYLFRKKKDLEEIDKLTHLGEEYLSAYLLLRKAFYSNYQDNLLPHNQWNQEEYLTKLASEIEDIAYQVRAYQSKEKDLF